MAQRSRALIYFAKGAAADDIIFVGTDANERALHFASIDGGLLRSDDLRKDASTCATISEKVTVDSKMYGNRYQALKTFPDGSVACLSMDTTSMSDFEAHAV
ncbi:Hypothetical protein PHPALM_17565 [Phytophthora palmivora]|uniref:Uncharacterized protein n=1 Tax=Phytophthora palmivora TaxID=4796 RepID=A0A2P4XM32_9STRA|nr:Hypothetical protein PHPALM_17565 [Phytophthora palmivora]